MCSIYSTHGRFCLFQIFDLTHSSSSAAITMMSLCILDAMSYHCDVTETFGSSVCPPGWSKSSKFYMLYLLDNAIPSHWQPGLPPPVAQSRSQIVPPSFPGAPQTVHWTLWDSAVQVRRGRKARIQHDQHHVEVNSYPLLNNSTECKN